MPPKEGDPQAKPGTDLDTEADRRRPGRQAAVNPQLVPLLRGQDDPDAPADPALRHPGRPTLDRELVSGALIAAVLLLVGALMRFAI